MGLSREYINIPILPTTNQEDNPKPVILEAQALDELIVIAHQPIMILVPARPWKWGGACKTLGRLSAAGGTGGEGFYATLNPGNPQP